MRSEGEFVEKEEDLINREKLNVVLAIILVALVLTTVAVGVGWTLWGSYRVEPINWSNYYFK